MLELSAETGNEVLSAIPDEAASSGLMEKQLCFHACSQKAKQLQDLAWGRVAPKCCLMPSSCWELHRTQKPASPSDPDLVTQSWSLE